MTSRLHQMEREAVPATPRKKIGDRQRLDLFIEQSGRCARCEAKCALPDMELDHVIPLGIGGKDERSNWQLLCKPCHSDKTHKEDRPRIRKTARQRAKDRGEFPESKFKLRSRGFPKGRNRQFEEGAG